MELVEDIVIVGAGIAGLTTALGLHRLGIRSLVLESHDSLRITGFALATWTNAWKALDAVGIAEPLRQQHNRLPGVMIFSTISGLPTAERPFSATGTQRDHEVRCVQRKILMETLVKELPRGNIKFSSKVVLIEQSGDLKLIHLSDGSILKAKVLLGCDGVNSVVAKWLGLKAPTFVGRFAVRGFVYYENGHGFEPKFFQFVGEGIRSGVVACNDKTMYWFATFSTSMSSQEMEENPAKVKQFVLSKLEKVADNFKAVIHDTELENLSLAPLRFRHPWDILWGRMSKSNVCVADDAFHPTTPDIGQGGCAALEDGVILARCLGEAMRDKQGIRSEEYKRIEMGLKNYAKERRWRAFELISTAYMVGYIQTSDGKIMSFLRDKVLGGFFAKHQLRLANKGYP
ncbi:hypothetical protein BT93_I1318 [Corymbia citriodora subsp. variegata]|nr:hypothetical protein BT93_I1318 [Corymbia citriodora subsp. variegata]